MEKRLSLKDAWRVVDCSDDPRNVGRVACEIVDAEQELRRQTGKPVIVMMGEEHHTIAHAETARAVTASLNAANENTLGPGVIAGLEVEHNVLGELTHILGEVIKDKHLSLTPEEKGILAALDMTGRDFLSAYSACCSCPASVTHHTLMTWLRDQKIPTRPIDVARTFDEDKNKSFVDFEDPRTYRIFSNLGYNTLVSLDCEDPKAVHGRNTSMSELFSAFMRQAGTPYGVILTGLSHLFGDGIKKYPFEQSLSALLGAKENFTILTVFHESTRYRCTLSSCIPFEAQEILKNQTIVTTGFDDRMVGRDIPPPEEAHTLRKFSSSWGDKVKPFPSYDDKHCYQLQDQFKARAPELVAALRTQQQAQDSLHHAAL